MRRLRCRIVCSCAALATMLGTTTIALANEVSDFYSNKQIRLVIGSAAGNGIDLLVRTVGRHLGKHIPGNPTIISPEHAWCRQSCRSKLAL